MNDRLDTMLQSMPEADKTAALVMLARTVAHELNNILTVIVGNLALLDEMAPESDTLAAAIADARNASERGIALSTILQEFAVRLPLPRTLHHSARDA